MKKILLVISLAIILILASFPSVVSYQTAKTSIISKIKESFVQQIEDSSPLNSDSPTIKTMNNNQIVTILHRILDQKDLQIQDNRFIILQWIIEWIIEQIETMLYILSTGYYEPGFYLKFLLDILIVLMIVPIIVALSILAVPAATLLAIPLSVLAIAYLAMVLIVESGESSWHPFLFMSLIRDVIRNIVTYPDWQPGFIFTALINLFSSEEFTWFPGISIYILCYVFVAILLLVLMPR